MRRTRTDAHGRKTLQLCEQVKRAVHEILADCADDVVRNLMVVSVVPAPNTGRLKIAVAVPLTADATDRATVETHLQRASGFIRTQVAAAISRRNVPELVWTVE
jgi:ribosome-binding factor A